MTDSALTLPQTYIVQVRVGAPTRRRGEEETVALTRLTPVAQVNLPSDYPFTGTQIQMLTPSGRFAVRCPICM